jgi:hypothetical protein
MTIILSPKDLTAPGTAHHPGQVVANKHTIAPSEIAVGVILGRASEYFDFFVFGIASVLVFPSVFFHSPIHCRVPCGRL